MTTEKQNKLIRDAFKDNEEALRGVRALILGLGATNEDKKLIKAIFNDELLTVFRLKCIGDSSKEAEVGRFNDFWSGTEKQIIGAEEHTIKQLITAKEIVKGYIEEAIKVLEKADGSVEMPVEDLDKDPLQSKLIARSMFISMIEQVLSMMKLIANTDEESSREIQEKMQKNSSR